MYSNNQLFQKAVLAHQNNQLRQAMGLYETVINKEKYHPDANHNLGIIHLRDNNPNEAIKLFFKAIKIKPETEQYWISYINTLIDENLFILAQEGLELENNSLSKINKHKLSEKLYFKKENCIPKNSQTILLLNLFNENKIYEAEKIALKLKNGFLNDYFSRKILGIIYRKKNKLEESMLILQEAININNKDYEIFLNIGLTYQKLNKIEEAEFSFKKAIDISPNSPENYFYLALLFKEKSSFTKSVALLRKAVQIDTKNSNYYYFLGLCLFSEGNLEQAKDIFYEAISINNNEPNYYNDLGITYIELGYNEQAEKSFKKAILLNANFNQAYNNLANLYFNNKDYQKACKLYLKALEIDPSCYKTFINLGNYFRKLNNFSQASENFKKAIKINPDAYEAYNNLGVLNQKFGEYENAEINYKKSIKINPNYYQSHNNFGSLLNEVGRCEEAISYFDNAISLNPNYLDSYHNRCLALNYSPKWSLEFVFNKHKEFGNYFDKLDKSQKYLDRMHIDPDKILNIGYVSGDFRNHSVSYFFKPLLKSHNHKLVKVFCYYNNDIVDETTEELKKISYKWRNIYNLSDNQVCKLIQEDKIDILVDLSGHTKNNRLLVFCKKPAPIQVSWLGYPNTTGLNTIDYRFTDKLADTDISSQYYTEKLIYLKNTFLCFEGDEDVDINFDIPLLNNGFITFGSFNNLSKVNRNVLEVWSKILIKLPNSRLVLKGPQFKSNSIGFEKILSSMGIKNDRVEYHPIILNRHEHLRFYDKIDICLDPFPYNGTTTSLEALWMGVPIITLCGERHAGLVGNTILKNLGLTNFISNDTTEYIEIANKMAKNPIYLSKIRKSLRTKFKNSFIGNSNLFAFNIEKEYLKMWKNYLDNLKKTS